MAKTTKPSDLVVVNGWYLDIPGLVSPHFEQLSGIEKGSGNVKIVDGGTNKEYSFSDQIRRLGEISCGRTFDGSTNDIVLDQLVEEGIRGNKIFGRLVKLHKGKEIFQIGFEGWKFFRKAIPTLDVNSGEKFMVQYQATVDDWIII